MRTRFRHALGIVAITAIAMHAALWGGPATRAATAAFDPFSVICHSGGNADTAPGQAPAGSAPSHACDHCNLCGSTPPPAASPTTVVVRLLTNQPSYALEPAPTIPHGGVEVALVLRSLPDVIRSRPQPASSTVNATGDFHVQKIMALGHVGENTWTCHSPRAIHWPCTRHARTTAGARRHTLQNRFARATWLRRFRNYLPQRANPGGRHRNKAHDEAGRQIATTRGPYSKTYSYFHGAKFTEGVKEVTWSGGKLPDAFYDEFVLSAFIAGELSPGQMLYFPVVQQCEQGEHRWIEIPAAGKHANEPAPGVMLTPKK